jgi:hypothetical protein
MKTILILLMLTILPGWLSAQSILPEITLRNLNGESISSLDILKPDKSYVIIV